MKILIKVMNIKILVGVLFLSSLDNLAMVKPSFQSRKKVLSTSRGFGDRKNIATKNLHEFVNHISKNKMLGPEKVLQVIESYIDQGANPNLKDEFGRPLLGMVIIFMRLIEEKKANTDLPKRVIEKILAQGADVNAVDQKGESALFEAANYGFSDVVRLLLEYGADPNLKNNNGKTVFDFIEIPFDRNVKIKKMLDPVAKKNKIP